MEGAKIKPYLLCNKSSKKWFALAEVGSDCPVLCAQVRARALKGGLHFAACGLSGCVSVAENG